MSVCWLASGPECLAFRPTTFIVGFPGETDAHELCGLRRRFDHVGCSPTRTKTARAPPASDDVPTSTALTQPADGDCEEDVARAQRRRTDSAHGAGGWPSARSRSSSAAERRQAPGIDPPVSTESDLELHRPGTFSMPSSSALEATIRSSACSRARSGCPVPQHQVEFPGLEGSAPSGRWRPPPGDTSRSSRACNPKWSPTFCFEVFTQLLDRIRRYERVPPCAGNLRIQFLRVVAGPAIAVDRPRFTGPRNARRRVSIRDRERVS